MRTLKFRAYGKSLQRMFYSDSHEDMEFMGAKVGASCIAYFFDQFYSSEVMQFTGLLDRNSKEIYEGDIVKQSYPGKIIGFVAYSTTAQFRIFYQQRTSLLNKKKMGEFSQRILSKYCEVVGNIYENPS